jgi:D-amino-acid dehydrogenase
VSLHVAVIGAGIVGAATAIELLRDGHEVTILEPGEPGGEQAASYGNGAWLSPSSVVPESMPGIWRDVPRYLADPLGPLAIRAGYLPRLAPWLLRFLRAGSTLHKVEVGARARRALLADSPLRHQRLAEEAGVGELIERRGLLYLYPGRDAFEADGLAWRLRRDNGISWIELDEHELRQREPEIDRRYGFGVLVEDGGHCLDPGAYVAALARHAVGLGAKLRRERALGFHIQFRRLSAVQAEQGDIACHKAVIAAGVWSKQLARAAGDKLPLESKRGYHALITNPEVGPRHPVMPIDGKMVHTMLRSGLRIAGQVELASLTAEPNWKRAEILRDYALRTYPGLPRNLPASRVKFWMGHRPATPDGLPYIGPARSTADIVYTFGHGHIGLASGAISGRLAADLVSGRTPVIDPAPYSPQRFG